jgi:hypothetical protein
LWRESGDASKYTYWSKPSKCRLDSLEHGSKSVSLGNIIDAYSKAAGKGKLKFANDKKKLFWQKNMEK